MRTAFFLLLLANVVFFAYGWFSEAMFPGESALLQQQINPGAIRVVAPPKPAAAASPNPAEAAPVAQKQNLACLEWGAFATAEAERAEKALAPLALGSKLVQRSVDENAPWWVFMPPQGSRAAANGKVGELKRLGVEDYYILQDDSKDRFAISLGIYRTQAAAAKRLEQLRDRGVRTAQIGRRETAEQKIWFQVRDVPEAVAGQLDELRQAFSGSEIRNCAAEASKN